MSARREPETAAGPVRFSFIPWVAFLADTSNEGLVISRTFMLLTATVAFAVASPAEAYHHHYRHHAHYRHHHYRHHWAYYSPYRYYRYAYPVRYAYPYYYGPAYYAYPVYPMYGYGGYFYRHW